ncbi:LysR family cyn operon transcriptional activator [Sphingobium xenophagum]|uniref:LysR family cyn operon transcriptional activator n=1 Tax=Sphingobium xenophagum TaxID=121428 RepID=A0ABU1X3J7_SPHXE|nr:transcriptional regulator CynR [Sphingobium xenophagum]MDR7156158.1 LysR family cyn operon transcriptional activator [Sphingobium xenophagum]
MLLRHLRYLSAVVEHGSFTRAAQALHVSQPALSQQIRQLEEQLGVQLLDRSGKAVRATDAGATYLSHIHRAFREIDAASRAAQDVNDLSSGRLRVGFTPSFSGYLIAPLARRFREKYPRITLDLIAVSQDEIETDLADDNLDCAIAFWASSVTGIVAQPLHTERLSLIARYDHAVMATDSIDVAGIEREEMVLLNGGFATRQTIDKHFKRHGIKPNVVIETSSMTTLIELVRSSSLVTVLPDAVAFERDDLRFRPLLPAIDERRVVLLQREGGYRSAAARAFVATLDAFVQELRTVTALA